MHVVLEAFCMQHARAQFDLAARAQCRLNAVEGVLLTNNVRNRQRRHWLCRLKNVGNNRMLFRKPFLLKRNNRLAVESKGSLGERETARPV